MPISMEGIANLSPDLQRAFVSAVNAERKPIENLNKQKGNLDAKLNLLNDVIGKVDGVRSLMPNLNSPIAIRELAFQSSDERVLTGTVDKNLAQPGKHEIEVLQLASSASAITNGFESRDSTVGVGYFSFTTASGEVKEVFIDDESATLDGVAKAINRSGMGIKAAVVNDQTDPEAPFRLVLTAEGTGTDKAVEFPDFYFAESEEDFYIESERPAQNGIIRYEGHELQIPSNDLNDIIPGVTVNLKGITDPGRPSTVTINQDIPRTTVKMKDLVDKVNQVFTFIQGQNKMDEKTDTTKTLGGDYSLRVSEQRLRNALSQNFLFSEGGRAIRTLADIGIEFQKTGTLSFDEKKFQAKLNANYDEVVELLVGDGLTVGIMPALDRALSSLSNSNDGVLSNQKKSETTKVERLNQEIDRREKNAERKADELKLKLSKAQTAISKMQQQGASIAQNAAPGSLVTQLIG